jgi:rhodanese-related sulfurtransferase
MEFTTGPVELSRMIERNESINIIDVRWPDDYAEGHIPGAVSVPKESWDTFSGLSRDKTNIIYCYSMVCHLAAAAARYFAEHDYPVMELQGGFEEWQRHNFPVKS